ncbi:GPTC4 protein, partial [Zapornia atra]|nr:GPTC4 protein [Zapornia atra]
SVSHRLTDEELMRVCGGRTAHKGARHGLTMSAKLARLEEQERAFLATYRPKEQQGNESLESSSPPAGRQAKMKKKRKKSRDGADPEVLQSQELCGEEEEEEDEGETAETEKEKKRKKKDVSEELAETEVPLQDTDGSDQTGHRTRKKRKKRKREPE